MKLAIGTLALLACFAPREAPGGIIQALSINVLRGEGGFNDIRHKIAAELVVEIRDDAARPVAGAEVVFSAPVSGAGGLFSNGEKTWRVKTDGEGHAIVEGFRPNSMEGRFAIQVTVSYAGRFASTAIWLTNSLAVRQKSRQVQ